MATKISTSDGNQFIYRDIIRDNPDDLYFLDIIQQFAPYTMTVGRGFEPAYSLYKVIQYLVKNKIPGDFVECGVWRGGMVILAALALAHFGDTERKIYLYDTFEGMTAPEDQDIDWDGKSFVEQWKSETAKLNNGYAWGFGGRIEEVQKNVFASNYPNDNFIFVKGPVEDTIPDIVPKQIAMLRLDTDWYSSTYHELVHLYPLLAVGGALIIDDYGWCRGARQATDQYVEEHNLNIFLGRVDESVRLAIKID